MNPELKTKWLTALRSGDYKQGKERLKNVDGTMCCLGVLCDLMGAEWTDPAGGPIMCRLNDETYGTTLTDKQQKLVGITADQRLHLASMNDYQKQTFDDIANWIEANL